MSLFTSVINAVHIIKCIGIILTAKSNGCVFFFLKMEYTYLKLVHGFMPFFIYFHVKLTYKIFVRWCTWRFFLLDSLIYTAGPFLSNLSFDFCEVLIEVSSYGFVLFLPSACPLCILFRSMREWLVSPGARWGCTLGRVFDSLMYFV